MSKLIIITVTLVIWVPKSFEFYQVPINQAGINAGFNPQTNFNGAFNQGYNQVVQGINAFQQSPQLTIQQQLLANQISGVQHQISNQVLEMQNQAHRVMQNQFQNMGNSIPSVQNQQLNLIRQMQEIARQREAMMNQNINQAVPQHANIPLVQQNQFYASHQIPNPTYNAQQIRPQIVPTVVTKPQQPVSNTAQVLNLQGLALQKVPAIETSNPPMIDGFINPFEVLKDRLSVFKLNQNPLLDYLTNIIRRSIDSFNIQFNNNYKLYLANTQDSIKLVQSGTPKIMQEAQNEIDKSLENMLALFRSNIIDAMRNLVKVLKIDVTYLVDHPENALVVLPNEKNLAYNLTTLHPTVAVDSNLTQNLSASNPTSSNLANPSSLPIATAIKNLKDKSALLIDDGTIFKNYLLKINSSEDTITQWDAMIKNKGESGRLNLTSFVKADPFCSCNDIVACNCCLSLNFNFFNKEVCLEAAVPKTTNTTRLSIILDKNRQEITQTQGLGEKVKFDFEGLASGVLEVSKREGSTKSSLEEEFCGAASLDILGLNFPALPLGCYSHTNDTFHFMEDLR